MVASTNVKRIPEQKVCKKFRYAFSPDFVLNNMQPMETPEFKFYCSHCDQPLKVRGSVRRPANSMPRLPASHRIPNPRRQRLLISNQIRTHLDTMFPGKRA